MHSVQVKMYFVLIVKVMDQNNDKNLFQDKQQLIF